MCICDGEKRSRGTLPAFSTVLLELIFLGAFLKAVHTMVGFVCAVQCHFWGKKKKKECSLPGTCITIKSVRDSSETMGMT